MTHHHHPSPAAASEAAASGPLGTHHRRKTPRQRSSRSVSTSGASACSVRSHGSVASHHSSDGGGGGYGGGGDHRNGFDRHGHHRTGRGRRIPVGARAGGAGGASSSPVPRSVVLLYVTALLTLLAIVSMLGRQIGMGGGVDGGGVGGGDGPPGHAAGNVRGAMETGGGGGGGGVVEVGSIVGRVGDFARGDDGGDDAGVSASAPASADSAGGDDDDDGDPDSESFSEDGESGGYEGSEEDDDDGLPFVHIVNTRFMQEQASLLHLSRARLLLFEAFCLPTVINQSVQPSPGDPDPTYTFLWIIKTDPGLDGAVRDRLVELLAPHRNFFLVGSNANFGIGRKQPGSWRGGEAGTDVLDEDGSRGTAVHTGDRDLLVRAHRDRGAKISLETRLDADDGMVGNYLEYVQGKAVEFLGPPPPSSDPDGGGRALAAISPAPYEEEQKVLSGDGPKGLTEPSPPHRGRDRREGKNARWMYWCVSKSLSWYPTVLEDGFRPGAVISEDDPGYVQVDTNNGKTVCLTPGLTLGLAVGVDPEDDVPRHSHYDLLHELAKIHPDDPDANDCGLDRPIDCVFLATAKAVRARSVTSAGMKNLRVKKKDSPADDDAQWTFLNRAYAMSRAKVVEANLHMRRNLVGILRDNLRGQCTLGHSCKPGSKALLQNMIEAAERVEEDEAAEADGGVAKDGDDRGAEAR